MSNRKQVGLVLAGAGAVGSNLLRVVERKFSQALAAQLQLVVVAIGDSRGFVVRNSGLSWDHVRNLLAHKASGGSVTSWTGDTDVGIQPSIHASLLQVVEQLHAHGECDKYVLIDCTSSQAIAPALVRGKQLGFAVIMANKLPLSGESEVYDQLVFTDDNRRSPLVQYEATVGAGLPVITTLRRIVASCDTISSVQGSFSGTIGYVLAEMNRGGTFSAALSAAHALGITEPDPRDDLSGTDVARKMVILAREMGLRVEISSVVIETLVPDELFALSVSEFLAKLSELDAAFGAKWRDADSENGSRLAYLGTITGTGELRIGLETVPHRSVFANTQSTEGAVEIRTEWFPEPVVVRGTGAGIHSTAAALAADLAQVLGSLSPA
ncbi:hypothetical protein Gpo141_00003647 [Globisporangium polare]